MNDLVAYALAISMDDVDAGSKIAERIRFLRKTQASLRADILSTTVEMLCPDNVAQRTKEDTYDVLNAIDDVRGTIRDRYYIVATSSLPITERHAFREFLNKFKADISYVKVDNSVRAEERNLDVQSSVERRCNELRIANN